MNVFCGDAFGGRKHRFLFASRELRVSVCVARISHPFLASLSLLSVLMGCESGSVP